MKRLSITVLVALATVTMSCGKSGNSYSILAKEQVFVQDSSVFNNKVDILFLVNDEPSMSSFQAELVQSMASFMEIFSTKGYDFKIAVATTSGYMADPTLNNYSPSNASLADFNDYNGTVHSNMPIILPDDPDLFGNFAINAQPVKNSAGQDGRAFSSFRQALQTTRPANAGFLRSDSFLALVLVDNQDDFSGNGRCTGCNVSGRYSAPTLDPVSVYIDFLNTLTGTSGASRRYNVSAMTQSVSPCQGGTLMTRIMELANQTNGVIGDICQADFGASMAVMANQIAMLSSQFFLDGKPVVDSITVRVNGALIPQSSSDGWTYDSEANSVVFHGSAIPQQGSTIAVNFDPESITF